MDHINHQSRVLIILNQLVVKKLTNQSLQDDEIKWYCRFANHSVHMESERLKFKYTNHNIAHRVCFRADLSDVMIYGFGLYALCDGDIEEFEVQASIAVTKSAPSNVTQIVEKEV